MAGIDVIGPDELEPAEGTPGIVRRVAFETENTAVVHARIAGGTTTDWHHHGGHHDFAYVVDGRVALEFEPDGREVLEAHAGDFIHVAPGVIHRDRNLTDEDAVVITSFVGSGPLVVNVDGPYTE